MYYICTMKVKIYTLIDPITCKIRYIGRTTQSLNKRLIGHLSKSRLGKSHKNYWIQSLLKQGLIPKIKEIKTVEGWSYSHEVERNYIKKALKYNFNLTNSDDRGEGHLNKIMTFEQKLKISNTLKEGYKTGRIKFTNIKKVSVFDLDGNLIDNYESGNACIEAIGIPRSSLESILSKRCRRWTNYQITYGENPGKYISRTDYTQNNIRVSIHNIITNEILYFDNYKFAGEYLQVPRNYIGRNLNKLYKGMYIISKCPQ